MSQESPRQGPEASADNQNPWYDYNNNVTASVPPTTNVAAKKIATIAVRVVLFVVIVLFIHIFVTNY